MGEEINIDFINKLRLSYFRTKFSYDQEEEIIVSEDETHCYLLRNFSIDDNILDFYYSHTNRFFSNEDYEKMVTIGYVGRKERTLIPYPFVIYGAYFNRIDLITKLQNIIFRENRPRLNGKPIIFFSDLIPYFKEYANGFKNGYEGFDKDCIKKYLPSFCDKNDYIYKVFEYVTKKIIFDHDWQNNHSGFAISKIENGHRFDTGGEIVDAFDNGQKQGYFYKAWSIIFSNNNLFSPLFKEYYENLELQTPEPGKTKKDSDTEINQKFTAKEYALAYIFDLYSKGEQVPKNRTNDSGLDKKHLEDIGVEKTNGKLRGNTFYNAVKEVLKYDLNNSMDLQNISSDWKNAVLTISNNNSEIKQYLENKGLI